MDHLERLAEAKKRGIISAELTELVNNFFICYRDAVAENGYPVEKLPILNQFLELVILQLRDPYSFEPYHESIREPIDYYKFGLDLVRPLVVFPKSTLLGTEHLKEIEKKIAHGENVILFANHQTEPDPQAISLLLEKDYPKLAEQMIFVAGQRVITDPLAVPFSLGRNLLCIFAKRYIEMDPELKQEKLTHNQQTMRKMAQLLSEGGKCIYVAPSGGRDRPDAEGKIAVAPFDPQSIEMFRLMGTQSGRPTHFHTLALASYDLFPPPSSIDMDLGERRQTDCSPVHLFFGPAIDMAGCVDPSISDKKERRIARANYIWGVVNNHYQQCKCSD